MELVCPFGFFGRLEYDFFTPLEALTVQGNFPFLMLLSIRSPTETTSAKVGKLDPTIFSMYWVCRVSINISISSLSRRGGWTRVASSLHRWAYSLNDSLLHWVMSLIGCDWAPGHYYIGNAWEMLLRDLSMTGPALSLAAYTTPRMRHWGYLGSNGNI